ncbi:MAG: hypothetical protein GY809_04790 [Planctomycetes bacterium]|nr:hypothetical protein [Planctomycetota bacterium]
MLCPKCRIDLQREKSLKGVLWQCPQCQGVAANLAVLRKLVGREVALTFWREAMSSTRSDKACPSCTQALSVFTYSVDQNAIELDLCKRCQFIWFDTGELEAFPLEAVILDDWPTDVKQKLAIAKVQQASLNANPLMSYGCSSRFEAVTCIIIRIITLIIFRH